MLPLSQFWERGPGGEGRTRRQSEHESSAALSPVRPSTTYGKGRGEVLHFQFGHPTPERGGTEGGVRILQFRHPSPERLTISHNIERSF